MDEQIHTPADCALVIAVPSTEAEFMHAAASRSPDGFIARMRGEPPRRVEWVWRHVYAPIAALMTATIEEGLRIGVTVFRAADLARLGDACRHSKIVTLIAHWRFPGLSPEDLLDPSAALSAVLAAREGPLARIGARLGTSPTPGPIHRLVPLLCAEVAASEHLSRARERVGPLPRPGPGDATATGVHRVDLDLALPPTALRPAGVVEFAEGFRSIRDVLDMIPPAFSGVLELSICNSASLGLAIRRARPGCLAIVHQRRSSLVSVLAIYRAVLHLLASQPQHFVTASTAVHRALIDTQPRAPRRP